MDQSIQNSKKPVTCVVCRAGGLVPGRVTVAFDLRGGGVVVFRDVPAQVCDNCNERYFDESTTGELLRQAKLVAGGTGVEVRPYAAA